MHTVFPLKAISALQWMSHDWIKKEGRGFLCVGVLVGGIGGGVEGGVVGGCRRWNGLKNVTSLEKEQSKRSVTAGGHTTLSQNIGFGPLALHTSTRRHTNPCLHANTQKTCRHGSFPAPKITPSCPESLDSHTCTHTGSSSHQFSYLSVLGERWFGTARCFDH